MKIYAPVKDFNGWRNTVRFVNGVGESNDPKIIEWFRIQGYKVPMESVEEVKPHPTVVLDDEQTLTKTLEEVGEDIQPDFDSMSPLELREWATQNGYGSKIKNTRNKEKLLDIIRG